MAGRRRDSPYLAPERGGAFPDDDVTVVHLAAAGIDRTVVPAHFLFSFIPSVVRLPVLPFLRPGGGESGND